MHWSYFWELLKGLFVNPISPWLSIPSYLMGIVLVLIGVWPIVKYVFPEIEDKMNKMLPLVRKFRVHLLIGLFIISLIISAYSLYENKTPTFATPSELAAPILYGLSIRATDLVPIYSEPVVSGKVFENCTFYGPSVWSIRGNTNVINDDLTMIAEDDVSADTAIISTSNEKYIGVIIFENNVFKGVNKLHNISIISNSPENVEKMRDDLRKSMELLGK